MGESEIRIKNKKGVANSQGTVDLVMVHECNTGCNYIQSEKLLCRATTSFTLISGAVDKVASPTLIWQKKKKSNASST